MHSAKHGAHCIAKLELKKTTETPANIFQLVPLPPL